LLASTQKLPHTIKEYVITREILAALERADVTECRTETVMSNYSGRVVHSATSRMSGVWRSPLR